MDTDGEEYYDFGDGGNLNDENFDESKHQAREKAKYLLKVKFDKYTEKVWDVFKAYCENITHSDTDSDGDATLKNVSITKSHFNTKTEFETDKDPDTRSEKKNETDKPDNSRDDNVSETTKKTEQNNDSMLAISKNINENELMQVPQVKISKLNKVVKDLGYLLGLIFTTYDDYTNGNYDDK